MTTKIKREDIMVDGSRVLQKEFTGGDCGGVPHYNWYCIASFHHLKGGVEPVQMAETFADAISEL